MKEVINSYSFEWAGGDKIRIILSTTPEKRIDKLFRRKKEADSIEVDMFDFLNYLKEKIEGKQSVKRFELKRDQQLYIEDISVDEGEITLNEDFISLSNDLKHSIAFIAHLHKLSKRFKEVKEETDQNIDRIITEMTQGNSDDIGYLK